MRNLGSIIFTMATTCSLDSDKIHALIYVAGSEQPIDKFVHTYDKALNKARFTLDENTVIPLASIDKITFTLKK